VLKGLICCDGMKYIELTQDGVRFTGFIIISVVLSGGISRHLVPISHFSLKINLTFMGPCIVRIF
jgi:hypothetical protein